MRSRLPVLLIVGASVVGALPWLVDYWPAHATAAHAATLHIASHADRFADVFTVDLSPRPYRGALLLAWLFARLLGVVPASRLLLTLSIVAIPLATHLLLSRTKPERAMTALLTIPISLSLTLIAESGYILAAAAGLAATAMLLDPLERVPSRRRRLLAAGLLVAATFANGFVGILFAGGVVAMEGRALRERAAWKRVALVVGPALLFVAVSVVLPHRHTGPNLCLTPKLAQFDSRANLGPCIGPHVLAKLDGLPDVARAFVAALGPNDVQVIARVPFLFLAAFSLVHSHVFRAPVDGNHRRLMRLTVVVLVGSMMFSPLVLPWIFGIPHGAPILIVLALAWCPLPASFLERKFVAGGLAYLVGVVIGDVRAVRTASEEISDVVELASVLPRRSAVLPLDFGPDHDPRARAAMAWLVVEHDIVVPTMNPGGTSMGSPLNPIMYRRQPSLPEEAFDKEDVLDVGGYDRLMLFTPPITMSRMRRRFVSRVVAHRGTLWILDVPAIADAPLRDCQVPFDVQVQPAGDCLRRLDKWWRCVGDDRWIPATPPSRMCRHCPELPDGRCPAE